MYLCIVYEKDYRYSSALQRVTHQLEAYWLKLFSDFAVTTAILPDIQRVMSDNKVTANNSKALRLFPTEGNAVQGLDGARFPRWEIRVNMMVF